MPPSTPPRWHLGFAQLREDARSYYSGGSSDAPVWEILADEPVTVVGKPRPLATLTVAARRPRCGVVTADRLAHRYPSYVGPLPSPLTRGPLPGVILRFGQGPQEALRELDRGRVRRYPLEDLTAVGRCSRQGPAKVPDTPVQVPVPVLHPRYDPQRSGAVRGSWSIGSGDKGDVGVEIAIRAKGCPPLRLRNLALHGKRPSIAGIPSTGAAARRGAGAPGVATG